MVNYGYNEDQDSERIKIKQRSSLCAGLGDNTGTQSRGIEEKDIIEEVEDPSHCVVHCFGTEFSFDTLCCILDNFYLKFYLLKYFLLFEELSFEVFVIIIGWISGIYIYQNKNKK